MIETSSSISRADFGEDFIFGGASSAYQNEGAATKDGKGPSIWDTFTNKTPEKIIDGSNGNVAIDQYHHFKEDIQMMKKMGLDAYRFSVSWSRVLPGGRISGGVNKEGIKYYNNLINELLVNGIQPFVTLFHWDVPQALEDEYGGFLSKNIVNDFTEYAELCFWEFGDRVKYWTTLNEPWSFATGGYVSGSFAPGRGYASVSSSSSSSSPPPSSSSEHLKDDITLHRSCNYNPSDNNNNNGGDPATEPYLVAHHLLLAHAQAVTLYWEHFKSQGGIIGIILVSQWWEPLHNIPNDNEAVERALDFMFGWFMEPISSGKYPESMIDRVGSRLPKFTEEESANLKGCFDFIGLNYYTSLYVTDATPTDLHDHTQTASYFSDQQVTTQVLGPDGKTPIGNKAGSSWLYIHPVGIYKLLRRIKTKYNDPLIFITENGVDEVNDNKLTVSEAREDPIRIKYHKDHLTYIKNAINIDKVKVKGYFIWSVFDNFEWGEGYSVRFGVIHVNYKDSYARYPKKSAIWFMNFLKNNKKSIINGEKIKKLANKRGLDEVEHLDLSSIVEQNPKKKAIKN